MGKRVSIFSILVTIVVIIGGCSQPVEPPAIVGRTPRIQQFPTPADRTVPPAYSTYPSGWVPPRGVKERRWKAIIIHHSAQPEGNMAMIDKYHKDVNGWDGVGYDFVIGNGSESRDGQVEVTFRWKKQIAGAHCGGTPNNRANEYGIGICLIGDFTETRPTRAQQAALTKLVRFLQKRYKIPARGVYGHGETPGYTRGSICPGKYFNMPGFKRSL
jgi:hypothetical protein